jgi:hypothetical protein
MRISWLMTGCVAAGLCAAGVAADEQLTREQAAQDAAQAWLELVDKGEYGQSWENASSLFRKSVSKEQWIAAAKAAREPLGRLVSRSLRSSQFATELPGAPDGEFFVLQFQASFENKRSAVETITPMRDEDGTWRVSGYYIK